MILYRIATREGRTSVAMFLLGGLAIAALANAGLGLLVFLADDRQLRDINFWMLGSLSGATWTKVGAIAPFLVAAGSASCRSSRADSTCSCSARRKHSTPASSVERLKRDLRRVGGGRRPGAAVSVSGVIGFVGLIVPHLLRLLISPSHNLLMPAAALLGAALLVGRRHLCAHAGGTGRAADRHRDRGDRGAGLSLPVAATALPARPVRQARESGPRSHID